MKIAVEFPSVMVREGAEGIACLARAIEDAGYDQIDMFDHVVMGHPLEGRPRGPYPADMPILEALVTLGFLAGVTRRIGLGTEVLVLPQRQPVLVAKQASTLDLLSGRRIRLGLGVGWQESEYEALGVDFHARGRAMDESLDLLARCFSDASIDHQGRFYRARAIAMEPKSRPGGPPLWFGGFSEAAFRRTGERGAGWLGAAGTPEQARRAMDAIRGFAVRAGRDPASIGFQAQLTQPPRAGQSSGRDFYGDPDRVAAAAARAKAQGFDWITLNATGVFLAGARSSGALGEALAKLRDRIRAEVG
jgi:probable F420-dependent oxidoreductase